MKYTYKKIIMCTCCIGLSLFQSCDSIFDVKPESGVTTDNYYNNTNDLNGAAYGMFASIAPEVHKLFLWGSARADFVIEAEGHDAFISEFINNKITPQNPYTDYGFIYKAIARCNHHLANIHRVKPSDNVTPEKLEIFYGEAYFLRAWCYFQLVRTFGEVPVITEEISEYVNYVNGEGEDVAMPTLDLSEEELRQIALKPKEKQEVWKVIISDLNKAMKLLKPEGSNWYYIIFPNIKDMDLIRGSLMGAYSLAAEVALWNKQYDRASGFANYVLNYAGTGGTNWYQQYVQSGSATTIMGYSSWAFMYKFNEAFRTHRLQEYTSNIESDGGKYYVKPAMSILNRLFDVPEDIRREFTWKRINREDVIWKYIGLDLKGDAMRKPYESEAAWSLLKHSDVFLIKAIAENRMGNSGMALDLLNEVRMARNLLKIEDSDISLDMANMENMLFDEKAREGAFEGRRWYDLLLREEVLGTTGIIAKTVSEKYPEELREQMYAHLLDPKNWYLPIEPERWK